MTQGPLRSVLRLLRSPAWAGAARWGNGRRSRMSVLSVAAVALFVAAGGLGLALKAAGQPAAADTAVWVVFGLGGLVFVAAALDDRRDRRLGRSRYGRGGGRRA
ncbi:MAG: hypothetical protein JWO31_1979 [Phycisphaerales bacterium]|nr:hypothetical protein [Phycisphaerales bacterium]